MKEFETYILPNGIRGIHRQVRSGVTHCALVVNAGSRDELPTEHGIAHLTEHALFKGTARRRAYQVNCRLENLGGELNAYTTKEDTTLHATVLRHDFSRAVELLADVIFRSTYPERELKKEREVIADEINTYKDSPAEIIYDSFEDMLFRGSELGHNILGTKASISRFSTAEIRAFVDRTYTTDQMVFSSIGNFSAATARSVAERYLAEFQSTERTFSRVQPSPSEYFDVRLTKHTHQAHGILGTRGYGISDDRRLPLALLVNILGGPSANSTLNLMLRERYGLSYNVEASYTPYSDSGIVSIYFSSDHGNVEQCIELLFPQGHFRGHDADAATGEMVRRHLQGRLDADHDQVGILLPDLPHRRGGGRIAGDHQGFHGIFTCKFLGRRQSQLPHLLGGLIAIRGVGGVTEVEELFIGHDGIIFSAVGMLPAGIQIYVLITVFGDAGFHQLPGGMLHILLGHLRTKGVPSCKA